MTFARKLFADGRIGEVVPLAFGRARIAVGDGAFFYDDVW